jgi:drug/metabolite transporter (DMT)-like permease
MTPILLALGSSFFFALSNVTINRGLAGMDSFTGLLVNLSTSALFLWLVFLLLPDRPEVLQSANLVFVAVGLLVPGVARLLIIQGIDRLGASITSCVLNGAPLFAILSAFLFLRESPSGSNVLGALCIVVGFVILSWRGATKTWRTADLLFPVAGALLFALRDNGVRFGLMLTPQPVLGAAIASTTSSLTIGAAYVALSKYRLWGQAARSSLAWFLISGFTTFLSYFFLYTALSLEAVSIVSPLANCSSLFVLPLSLVLLRGVERINARKVGATLLVVLGVFMISWEKW